MTRWQRYWFGDGGRTSVAILRIAIATSVLLTLARLDNPVSTHHASLYRPVGIWMVAGHHGPPAAFVTLLWILAWTSTALMLVGLFSRASAAVSAATGIALAALSFAYSRSWSHQYNVVFLASLAFVGARGGDMLSLDWLVRKKRGLPPIDLSGAYQWSIRLVQLAVALMFAGACFHKLLHGHMTLRWALSDNLRNHLLVRFDLAGLPRPPVVDWIIDDPWKYKTAAILNLLSQALPIAAVFLMKRPVLRALAGSFFLIETIALGLVVDLWNLHWLPLFAVFIDWDRLLGQPVTPSTTPSKPSRGLRLWIIAFFLYDAITAFVPTLDQRLNTFPFSSFPMFATIRARAPYGEHQAYGVAADHFEVYCDRQPLDISIQRWFDHANRGAFQIRDPRQLEKRLRAIVDNAQKRWSWWPIRGARLWLTIYESPAYPAPAHFESHPIAIIGEITADGTFRSALGSIDGELDVSGEGSLRLAPTNVDLQGAQLVYFANDLTTEIPVDQTIEGDKVSLGYQNYGGNPLYFVAKTKSGEPWLVATYAPWQWQ